MGPFDDSRDGWQMRSAIVLGTMVTVNERFTRIHIVEYEPVPIVKVMPNISMADCSSALTKRDVAKQGQELN